MTEFCFEDHPFWEFSLRVYGNGGVPTACLALQERHAIDVNLLLFCAWIGESGRGILGRFDGNRLTLEQVHRFENGGVALLDRLYWDPLRLFGEIESGLGMAGKMEPQLASVGIDTWGVDFVLLAADGTLLDNPRHYRDGRTDGMLETAFQIMPREQIFSHTGIQFMKLNSLYQLLALRLADAPQLAAAQQLLMIPDLLH